MNICDRRTGTALVDFGRYGNIVKLEMSDGAGSVTATLQEGYEVTLEYEEIEDFAREMMKKYTGNLRWHKEARSETT